MLGHKKYNSQGLWVYTKTTSPPPHFVYKFTAYDSTFQIFHFSDIILSPPVRLPKEPLYLDLLVCQRSFCMAPIVKCSCFI